MSSATKTALLLLIAAACSLLLTGTTSAAPAPPQPSASAPNPSPYDYSGHNCYNNVQKMSHCLIYMTSPSNETAKMWENACCPEFAAQVESKNISCLCFLLIDDKMEKLGLKIDKSRANQLPSICGVSQSIECRYNGTNENDTPPSGVNDESSRSRNYVLSRSSIIAIWAVIYLLTISVFLLCVIVEDHHAQNRCLAVTLAVVIVFLAVAILLLFLIIEGRL